MTITHQEPLTTVTSPGNSITCTKNNSTKLTTCSATIEEGGGLLVVVRDPWLIPSRHGENNINSIQIYRVDVFNGWKPSVSITS